MTRYIPRFRICSLRGFSYFLEDLNPVIPIILIAILITSYIVLDTLNAELLLTNSFQDINTKVDGTFFQGCVNTEEYLNDPDYKRQNATFLMLTRNNELEDVISTLENIESHFNQWFHYPYTFLNDEPFTEEFQNSIREVVASDVSFGIIDPNQWEFSDIEENKIEIDEYIKSQGDRSILYGDNFSYHKMCRFFSGFFYKHELVQKFEWYWRLEPSVEFFCDLTYDPFYEMQKNNKKYGFTIIIPELYFTIPNLFRTTLTFIKKNSIEVGSLWKLFTTDFNVVSGSGELDKWMNYPHDIMGRITENVTIEYLLDKGIDKFKTGLEFLIKRSKGKIPIVEDKFDNFEYNLCHFWSNFEIARVDIFDNEIYDKYFNFLESNGGFWKERWGDAPVHSLGLSLLLDVNEVHYFRDIGYKHTTLQHCPKNGKNSENKKEFPYIAMDTRWERKSRKDKRYDNSIDTGTGCRCKCPKMKEIEDNLSHCQNIWFDLTHMEEPNEKRKPIHEFNDIQSVVKEDFLRKNPSLKTNNLK